MKYKINLSELGTGPHPVDDTTNYLRKLFEQIGFEVVYNKFPIEDGINLLHEGFNYINVKHLDVFIDKYKFGIFKTELFVNNNSKNILDGSYNDWKLNKKILKGKSTLYYVEIKNLIYFTQKKLLNNFNRKIYFKYKVVNEYLKKNNKKKLRLFFSKHFFKIIIFVLYKLNIFNFYYFLIRSPHTVDHSNTSSFYEFFRTNIHWKDLCVNTYSRLNKFRCVLSLQLDENLIPFCKEKNISYINLPYIYLGEKKNIFFPSSKNFKYDILFTGLKNNYRNNILEKLSKKYNVKILDFIRDEEERKKINSESKIIISLKKNNDQSIVSLGRMISSFDFETPIIFESDEFMVPKYVLPYIETFDQKNMFEKFDIIFGNYDQFCKNYSKKINKYIQEYSPSEKEKLKKNMIVFYKNEKLI